jgi:aminoglycoside 6-adenylyltransferase
MAAYRPYHPPTEVFPRLIQWAEERAAIRAMLLTSTQARPDAAPDILSDYDVILVVRDIQPFYADRSWLADFGPVLVVYWDPIHPAPGFDLEQTGNVTQYEDGLKIDFTLWPVELLAQLVAGPELTAELDSGYRILVDKDQLAARLKPPTYTAYLPKPPTEEAYQIWINDFFSDAPYVGKCLWRGELLPLKWCLDYDMKHVYLRQMLEWWLAVKYEGQVGLGALGKGLKKRLPPDMYSLLEASYAGAGVAENWAALYRTIELFRRAAIEVGEALDYLYPAELDKRVIAYLQQMQRQSKGRYE